MPCVALLAMPRAACAAALSQACETPVANVRRVRREPFGCDTDQPMALDRLIHRIWIDCRDTARHHQTEPSGRPDRSKL